jgi:hypothetical protein
MTARWLHSPNVDRLAILNLWWPAVALVVAAGGLVESLSFVQLYFLSAPHRWLTILLVIADPDRRGDRPWLLPVLAVLVGVTVWQLRDSLACLLLIDTLWNAWHFGGQHAGILRMYARKAGGPDRFATFEKHALRLLVTFVGCRVAVNTFGLTDDLRRWFEWADYAAFALVALLVVLEWTDRRADRPLKRLYLASVLTLFVALLVAVRAQADPWIAGLAIASALVHAVEYFAIVSLYAGRRQSTATGFMASVSAFWPAVIGGLVLVIGWLGVASESNGFVYVWALINLAAAYLHYAFDGLIWKLRRPGTATALGVSS